MTTTSSRPIGGTDIRKFDIYLGGRRNLGGMGTDEGGGTLPIQVSASLQSRAAEGLLDHFLE